MKKYIICMFLFAFACTVVLADDAKYTNSLKNCLPYSESGNVNADGMNSVSTKQILGWKDNKCIYRETVQFSGLSANVECSFTKPQLHELSTVMEAYNITSKYSGEEVDVSSYDAVKNNPVVKVWDKYLQNPNVCTMETK